MITVMTGNQLPNNRKVTTNLGIYSQTFVLPVSGTDQVSIAVGLSTAMDQAITHLRARVRDCNADAVIGLTHSHSVNLEGGFVSVVVSGTLVLTRPSL